ncbi:MAG: YSC84-related protein [Wenzhouxiangella sp.]|jgi:lipid-binding SYLF domain-containing protein|nr:YSC84-related protein [Wenzhouxiangella sp.]
MKPLIRASITLLTLLIMVGCVSTPSDDRMLRESRAVLDQFVAEDPGLRDWVSNAYGYAVFPEIAKGGFWVGGGFGRGVVFERGEPIGRATTSQATIGAQIGAQTYSQVIFFRDQAALRTFQRGNLEFSAQATAVAATAGAAATTSYERGVAVFNMTRGGLMAEASVGGQRFTYEAL